MKAILLIQRVNTLLNFRKIGNVNVRKFNKKLKSLKIRIVTLETEGFSRIELHLPLLNDAIPCQ